jgi:hypothetical protein
MHGMRIAESTAHEVTGFDPFRQDSGDPVNFFIPLHHL